MTDFERIYAIVDYWDGPRRGFASFRGAAHVYVAVFDVTMDEYSDVFELRPVDDATLALALENWQIWLRWDDAFKAGRTTIATHPALPDDRARHDELAAALTARLAALDGP